MAASQSDLTCKRHPIEIPVFWVLVQVTSKSVISSAIAEQLRSKEMNRQPATRAGRSAQQPQASQKAKSGQSWRGTQTVRNTLQINNRDLPAAHMNVDIIAVHCQAASSRHVANAIDSSKALDGQHVEGLPEDFRGSIVIGQSECSDQGIDDAQLCDPAGHRLSPEACFPSHREQDDIGIGLYRRAPEIGNDNSACASLVGKPGRCDGLVR